MFARADAVIVIIPHVLSNFFFVSCFTTTGFTSANKHIHNWNIFIASQIDNHLHLLNGDFFLRSIEILFFARFLMYFAVFSIFFSLLLHSFFLSLTLPSVFSPLFGLYSLLLYYVSLVHKGFAVQGNILLLLLYRPCLMFTALHL